MEEEAKQGSKAWIWILIVALIIIAGVAVWFFTKNDGSTASTETKTEVVIPDGWKGFTSSKYGFSLSYPSDYTIEESAVGTLKLTKGSVEMIDLYVYAANGDEAGMMTSQEALYTDDAKGYMIMDEVIQGKVGSVTSKTVNGKFGKNAGVSQTHEGVTGSTTFFANDDKLFIFDSYDNGDAIAKQNFTDFLATISL